MMGKRLDPLSGVRVPEDPDRRIRLTEKISVLFPGGPNGRPSFPSSRIAKGPVLAFDSEDLSEEGVGFGLPVIKRGRDTVYPGSVRLSPVPEEGAWTVEAEYDLTLRERLLVRGKPASRPALYQLGDLFSRWHRRHPVFRRAIDGASRTVRRLFGIETRFEETPSAGTVRAVYTVRPSEGTMGVGLDFQGVRPGRDWEIFVMNELGAHFFRLYRDSDGRRLEGRKIGTWDETRAAEASFVDPGHGVAFSLRPSPAARLYRGREVLKGRLAWAGLTYRLPAGAADFRYSVRIEGSPA